MTSRQRLLTALQRGRPDRLPVTTHHVMPYFLDKYLEGIDYDTFFDRFGFDAIRWILPFKAETGAVEIDRHGFTRSADWQVEVDEVPGGEYRTTRYRIVTPQATLTMEMHRNRISRLSTRFSSPVRYSESKEAQRCDLLQTHFEPYFSGFFAQLSAL